MARKPFHWFPKADGRGLPPVGSPERKPPPSRYPVNPITRGLGWLRNALDLDGDTVPNELDTRPLTPVVDAAQDGWGVARFFGDGPFNVDDVTPIIRQTTVDFVWRWLYIDVSLNAGAAGARDLTVILRNALNQNLVALNVVTVNPGQLLGANVVVPEPVIVPSLHQLAFLSTAANAAGDFHQVRAFIAEFPSGYAGAIY